jgi:hypothetical protein
VGITAASGIIAALEALVVFGTILVSPGAAVANKVPSLLLSRTPTPTTALLPAEPLDVSELSTCWGILETLRISRYSSAVTMRGSSFGGSGGDPDNSELCLFLTLFLPCLPALLGPEFLTRLRRLPPHKIPAEGS